MHTFKSISVNHETKPIGITSLPYFSWKVDSDGPYVQLYYRINIATRPELIDTPDVFASAKFKSKQQNVQFDELQLKPFTRYFWKVGVGNGHDPNNKEFVWSDVAEFVTASLHRSQWKAQVFRNLETLAVCMERKEFTLKEKPVKAYLFAAATGEKSAGYHIFINGTDITDGMVLPGPLEYMTMSMNGFDVTDHIGLENIINLDHTAGLSCVLKLWYADGSEETLLTDVTWTSLQTGLPYTVGYKECYTPTRHHGKYELFDALHRPEEWYKYGGDISAYQTGAPGGVWWGPILIRYCGVKTYIQETLTPAAITRTDKGVIVDFGKVQSGFVKMTFRGCSNKITLHYAEEIENGEASLTQYGSEYPPITEYMPKGESAETYQPCFFHTSYRFVIIEGLDYTPAPEDITGCFVYSDILEGSAFSCSNAQLNYLYECIERSFKSNLFNVPTDSPGRERRGWTGDAYSVIDGQAYMYNVYNLYDRWFQDLHDNQRMNGWCTVEYPDQTDPCIDLNWPMHTVIIPHTLYTHTGDIRILEKNLDSMERYAELLYDLSDEHLFCENLFSYGDWVATRRATPTFMGSALYYYVTKLLAEVERILERPQQAEKYESRCPKIAAAINKTYFHEDETGAHYDDNNQTANTLALMFGFCEDDKKAGVFQSLTDSLEKDKNITVGFIANTWLYQVLSAGGRSDLAYQLLTDPTYTGSSMPRMVNRIRNYSLKEEFGEERSSYNHAFLGGGPAAWIYRCLAGITPLKAGFAEFEITPYFPTELDDLAVNMATPYGDISLSWNRDKVSGEITLTVSVPFGPKGRLLAGGKEYELKPGTNEFTVNPS